MTQLPEYYNWSRVPSNHRTKKQWLKKHRRLKKGAAAVGTITLIFDKPRARPKGVDAVSPEDCDRIRSKLMRFGVDPSDQDDLCRLDRAGQMATMNLFDAADTEAITAFTESEAKKLLEYMIWDGSHDDHFITETSVNGQRQRATWKNEFSNSCLTEHLAGERFFGTKRGQTTMQVTVDLDRHSGNVPGGQHVQKAIQVGEVLTSNFPEFRFSPEINQNNGSVKFFGWLRDFTIMPIAKGQAERIRGILKEQLPEYDFDGLEIFPSTSPQIFAPLRADKIMVIGDGAVKKVKAYRMDRVNGKRRRRYFETFSCADYVNWAYFVDKPFNAQVFEEQLREAVARCPDKVQEEGKTAPSEKKIGRKMRSTGQGMGSIGKLKGRCAATLVNFWSELDIPEDDTLGKFIIVTSRILRYEGLDSDQTAAWVEERLEALQNRGFSDRLNDNFPEIQRVIANAVDVVWDNNGYQYDPDMSETKLRATVDAWAKKGFFLHDYSTWAKHSHATVPDVKLVWSTALLSVIPELAIMINANQDQAMKFMERVLCFVQGRSELSESMVGILLEQCGIKGKSRQKQHDARKFLVNNGLLIKQHNYFCDKQTGYRHGNFYICGSAVTFQEEAQPQDTHTVSIYLSLIGESEGDSAGQKYNIVLERRRWACERRYRERIGRLKQALRLAA